MAYAITIDRVEIGDKFAETLSAILSHKHDENRTQETENLRANLAESAIALGKLHPDLVTARNTKVTTARQSAELCVKYQTAAQAAEEVHLKHKDDPVLGPVAAAKYIEAENENAEQIAVAKADEAAALAAEKAVRDAIPDAWVAHVAGLYDKQIAAGVSAAAVLVAAGALGPAKAAKIQLAGHVEADGTGFCSAHVWPA